jgi:hypothetical protein
MEKEYKWILKDKSTIYYTCDLNKNKNIKGFLEKLDTPGVSQNEVY